VVVVACCWCLSPAEAQWPSRAIPDPTTTVIGIDRPGTGGGRHDAAVPRSGNDIVLGTTRFADGDFEGALQAFRRVGEPAAPFDIAQEARLWEGDALVQLRRYDEARRAWEAAAAERSSALTPQALYRLGWLHLELRRPEAEFAVAKDGRLRQVTVRRSSGVEILDRHAVMAVEAAAPFPAVPDQVSGVGIPVVAVFTYVIESGR
jgi:TonB family protein